MHRESTLPRTAVLLLAFGGPGSVEEVGRFLERLLGREPSPQHVAGLRKRYQAIGGGSPLPETTQRVAGALEAALKKRGELLSVYYGMRYSRPFIAEALEEIKKEGIFRVILISLSPYRSPFSSEGYYAEVKRIVVQWEKNIELIQVDDWHAHPGLCSSWATRLNSAIGSMGDEKDEIPVIFTAHSLPKKAAPVSPYERQLEETIKGIIDITGPLHWHLAYQSRAGDREEWLGPEPEQILEDLMKGGFHKALICPIGFITDHLETLYDLDIVLTAWANERGLGITRVPCLNDTPELIEVLVQLVEGAPPKQ
jgi:ferrochelatase